MTSADRESIEVEALRTDRYVEALLGARERRADDAPADAGLDPAARAAASVLGRDLPRVHPSFRFEERLAERLASVAASMHLPVAAGGEAAPVQVPIASAADVEDLEAVLEATAGAAAHGRARPLIIGGAITSAAISLAGAAFVAWLRTRPTGTPMSRAVRAARQASVGRLVPLSASRRARLD